MVLIKRYVDRQLLPLQIFSYVRPDLLLYKHLLLYKQKAPIEHVLPMLEKYAGTSQIGYWGHNDQWKYYIHGFGCRVTHIETGEVMIMTPDQFIFDRYSFLIWLEWSFNAEPENNDVKVIFMILSVSGDTMKALIGFALDELERTEQILSLSPLKNKYQLVVTP